MISQVIQNAIIFNCAEPSERLDSCHMSPVRTLHNSFLGVTVRFCRRRAISFDKNVWVIKGKMSETIALVFLFLPRNVLSQWFQIEICLQWIVDFPWPFKYSSCKHSV